MIRSEGRIVVAQTAVFVSLAGIFAALRGLLFDHEAVMYYGVLAIFIGTATFVTSLMPTPNDDP